MASTAGLFTRQEIGKAKGRAQAEVSQDTLRRLGPGAVKNMNPAAAHPNMKPTGADRPLVYILGEAPGADEDAAGKQFVGASGKLLRANLPAGYKKITRFNNCVQTRPPNNRTPTDIEIEAFRSVVQDDIAKTKPAVLLVTGNVPLTWAVGKVKGMSIKNARGRFFPVSIKGHTCWVCPILHPAYLVRLIGRAGKITPDLLRDSTERLARQEAPIWARDIETAYEWAMSKNTPDPVVVTPEEAKEGIDLFLADQTVKGLQALAARVYRSLELGKFTLDLETTHLRPYSDGAKLVSIAIADADGTYAFCVDHPQQNWGPNRKEVWKLVGVLARCDAIKVAHNLAFDLEWLTHLFGWDTPWCGSWHCTMAQAFVLDERKGGHNLNFLTTLRFGLQVKKLSDVNRLTPQNEDPKSLLIYNGMDSRTTRWLFNSQTKLLKSEGKKLASTYDLHRQGICPVVLAEHKGLPVSQPEVRKLSTELDGQINKVTREIMGMPEVSRYKKRFGDFNPASPDHLTQMFRDLLGSEAGQRGKKYSTDEDVLQDIGSDLSLACLKRRKLTKLKSTYIDSLDNRSKDTVVYADGKVHTQLNTCLAETARLSSEDPNLQNIPTRTPEGRRIRGCFVVGDDELLVSTDYGQIEYRVIGMASHDKVVMDSCFTEYDVHMEWARKIVKRYSRTFKRRYGKLEEEKAWKAFRSDVKNQWVFPQFFGSSYKSCAANLDMPPDIAEVLAEEFWEYFYGVRTWQKATEKFYNRYGFVECLTGRRRHGPLNYNMIINTPIQGTAAEIIRKAWIDLGVMAARKQNIHLAPNLQIHDDLTGVFPAAKAQGYIRRWVRTMLTVPFDFINVPISVEVKVGKNWQDMKEVGKFRSDQLDKLDAWTLNP